jgi:Ca-activated chloride channel family protein
LASPSADISTFIDPVAGLIDIPLPPEVSLWPTTWPARIAIALLVVGTVIGTWKFLRYRHANRYRREALSELAQIERTASQPIAARLAVLVRRTALAAFPREQIAPLAGDAWLAFLDRSLNGTEFSAGAGRLLASAPYAPSAPDENELAALVALTRRWIRRHHV